MLRQKRWAPNSWP
uniref:Uncharacterized protein n=1 Tax=Arundo donax TaxID=35708 RepID=A0A0A8Z7I8_ARUDO